jgi:uncharacterized membrane protein YbhN (UPF0104 family)
MSIPLDVLLLGARRAWRVLPVIPPLLVLTWALMSWTKLDAGLDLLRTSDPRWLLLASVFVWIGFGVGALAQQGAVMQSLPWRSLLAVQMAAGLANHFTPASTGGGIVNMNYLRRQGLTRSQALSGIALNSAATIVTHVAILVAVVVLAPHTLAPIPLHVAPIAIGAGVLVAAGAIAVIVWRRGMRDGSGESRWRHTVGELRLVCRHPTRALQLWGAALTAPLMHGAILVCIAHAIGLRVGVIAIVVTYFAASGLASLAPSFGGMGALDLTLGVALARLSGDSAAAIAVVLGYRLATTWIPLIPSAIAMALLMRKRIL